MRPLALVLVVAIVSTAGAQEHRHTPGMTHPGSKPPTATPTMPGQDAFGAIAEVVRLLEADSTTDWSRVNLEALRQHLVDMNEVTLRSGSRARVIDGGIEVEVTGTGRTADAIRRIVVAHASVLDALPDYVASGIATTSGARLTVKAERPSPAAVARIRGLGFIGLLTVGDHHAAHHLALASGDSAPHSH